MALGAVVARIITQYSDKGSKAAQKDINKLGKTFDDFGRKVARSFAIAAAAAGAFAIKIGKDAVQAAIADQKSQVLLANSLRNTTGATNAAIASVEGYISKLQLQVGVADDELRPALSRLAAVTSDVSSAQNLLGTALDVSAFATVDLGTATKAITKALQGNFRSLQNLVPGLDAATIKGKKFGEVLAEVEKITSGAAATRAGTLEFRLQILRIRFGEILETLGYALLPVIEQFADTIQRDVLPQIERFIAANKAGLVDGFKNAAEAGIKVAKAMIAIGFAIAENIDDIILLAGIFATMWVTSKVYAFAKAVAAVSLAFNGMKTAAAGAAVASAAATGGAGIAGAAGVGAAAGIAGTAVIGGIAALTYGLGQLDLPGTRKRAKRLAAEQEKRLSGYAGSPGAGDIAGFTSNKITSGMPTVDSSMSKYLKFLEKLQKASDKLNGKKKKELTTEQKIIDAILKKNGLSLMTSEIEAKATAEAIRRNLNRQKNLGISSPTISLVASANTADQGTLGNNGATAVTVNITTPYGTKDDFFVDVSNNLKTLRRRSGMTPSGKMTGIGIE
jgi:hypothetical protein